MVNRKTGTELNELGKRATQEIASKIYTEKTVKNKAHTKLLFRKFKSAIHKANGRQNVVFNPKSMMQMRRFATLARFTESQKITNMKSRK